MEDSYNLYYQHYNHDSTGHSPEPWDTSNLPSTESSSQESEKLDRRAFMLRISELISSDDDDDFENQSNELSEKNSYTEKMCSNEWLKLNPASSMSYRCKLPY